MKQRAVWWLLLAGLGWSQPIPSSIHISSPSPGQERGGTIRAARNSPMRRQVLRNGLRVLVNEAPQENIVALEILIQAGAMEESTPIEGMNQILQELLQKRVTQAPDGSDRVEECAAQFRVTPEMDYVRLSLLSTREDFPGLFKAVAEAIKNHKVTEAELEEVRKKMIQEADQSPGALGQLYDIFRQSFYRYHPYKRTGRPATAVLERLKPRQVEEFLDQYFVANRTVVSISGRVDRNEATQWVEKELQSLVQRESSLMQVNWEPKSTEKEVYLTGGGEVGWLFVGYPAPPAQSRDYVAMRLIHSILGEGLSSRLFTEIREKRSLCYELGSMYPVLKGPSHFLTYTVTKPEQVWPARKQFLIEIERLKRDGIGHQELEECKRKLIGAYWQERETNQGRAYQSALAELIGVGYEFDSQFLRLVEAVNPTDIKQVAQRYLDNATLIVARPRGVFYWDL